MCSVNKINKFTLCMFTIKKKNIILMIFLLFLREREKEIDKERKR